MENATTIIRYKRKKKKNQLKMRISETKKKNYLEKTIIITF